MIPCHVCGSPVQSGWILGLPPAPDSQKMALCSAHDTFPNRQKTMADWKRLMRTGMLQFAAEQERKHSNRPQLIYLFFQGGGSIAFPCARCAVRDGKILEIATPDGRELFYPMAHIASFELAPMKESDNAVSPSDSPKERTHEF